MITSCLLRQEWKTTSLRFERELITGLCLFLFLSFHFQPREQETLYQTVGEKRVLMVDLEEALPQAGKHLQDKCSSWQPGEAGKQCKVIYVTWKPESSPLGRALVC